MGIGGGLNFNAQFGMRGGLATPAALQQAAIFQAQAQGSIGGVSADAMIRGGVSAQFGINDSFAMAQGGFGGGFGVSGFEGMGGFMAGYYQGADPFGGFGDPAQMQAVFGQRMEALDGMANAFEFAANMGAISPSQMSAIQQQAGAFEAFAQGQMGGAQFQAGFNVNFGAALETQMAMAQLEQQQMQLVSYQQGLEMLMQRQGMSDGQIQQLGMAHQQASMQLQQLGAGQMQLQQQLGMFQAQVGQQLQGIHGQMGVHEAHLAGLLQQMGIQGDTIHANSNGIAQLAQELGGLQQAHGGLGGVVNGLGDKLGILQDSLGQFRGDVASQMSGLETSLGNRLNDLSASTDTKFGGVSKEMATMLGQIQDLMAELKATKQENVDLKAHVGSEFKRVDERIDLLSNNLTAAVTSLNARIDSEIAGVNTKIDKAVGELQAKDAELAGDLKTFKGEYNTFVEATQKQFSAQASQIRDLGVKIDQVSTNLSMKIDQTKAELQQAIEKGDKALETKLTATQKDLEGVKAEVAKHSQAIAEQTKRLNYLTSRMSTLSGQVADLIKNTSDLPALRQKLAGLQREMAGVKADIGVIVNVVHQHHQAIDRTAGHHVAVDIRTINGRVSQYDPLTFDVNGDGKINRGGQVTTDIVTGETMKTRDGAWVNAGDGFLLLDLGDDKPTLLREGVEVKKSDLVNEAWIQKHGIGDQAFTTDGWNHLAAYDKDGDGFIRPNDPVFSKLTMWVDANMDGKVDTGEKKSLADLGITSFKIPKAGETIGDAFKGDQRMHGEDIAIEAAQ